MNNASSQVVQKYGPVLHYAKTWHRFDEILNNVVPAGMDGYGSTILIKGPGGQGFATFILDVGDNGGNNLGYNPFRFIIFKLDSNGQQTTYNAVAVKDTNGVVINAGSLGRVDGHATFGPGGKIYIPTYGSSPNYLIEFDQNTYTAKAYPAPAGLAEFFLVNVGPPVDSTNPRTLVYGSTFNASQVWWLDPSAAHPKIEFVQFEVDSRQNYIHQVTGKGDWIYAKLSNMSLAGGAFRSLYGVNTVTKKKYCLFHSTKANFSVRGFKDKHHPGQNNLFLVLNGKAPGTVYPNPVGIDMSVAPPTGVLSNNPCYNIDPQGMYWPFPASIRNTYFNTSHYSILELTGFSPEYTTYQYNQNYAWDKATHQPFPNPPTVAGEYICNPSINNGAFINFPWDMPRFFPQTQLPAGAYNYYFRLNGGTIDTADIIEDGYNSWSLWDSYDPMYSVPNKPATHWDNYQTLTYQFPGKSAQTKRMGFFTQTGNINDLHDYDANLTGLSMTAVTGQGLQYGAATIVKGEKQEGVAILNPMPVTASTPLGYRHQFAVKNVTNSNDILALGPMFTNNKLATHMNAGYPGDVELYTYGNKWYENSACRGVAAGVSQCNPRMVAKMYPLETLLPNGDAQYGPETNVGARLYSPDYYAPVGETNYKIMTVGIQGRARQGQHTAIGLYNFKYKEPTGEITYTTSPYKYKVIDRINYSYFDDYTPICISNETVPLACLQQKYAQLGNINSYYNEGKGYSVPANESSCRNQYLRTVISVRSINATPAKNQLWLFNPSTDKIDAVINIDDSLLNAAPIESIRPISDFYIAKASGCSGNRCVKTIFLFRIVRNQLLASSIVKLSDTTISSILSFHVTGNMDDFTGNGRIFKVFISYLDNQSIPHIGTCDIVASNNRQTLTFTKMTNYTYNYSDKIVDFAYVPKDHSANTMTDLLMVGGKNLYVLKNVVPLNNYSSKVEDEMVEQTEAMPAVYPNPFTTSINIDAALLKAGAYSVKLTDNTGKTIVAKQITIGNHFTLQSLSVPASLSKGLYILHITGNSVSKAVKLMKR